MATVFVAEDFRADIFRGEDFWADVFWGDIFFAEVFVEGVFAGAALWCVAVAAACGLDAPVSERGFSPGLGVSAGDTLLSSPKVFVFLLLRMTTDIDVLSYSLLRFE
ncbi:hypothetical protein [Parvibaculum sp.]|uniref:hypothetical protein n=1 Tax=Parvibaculum sp. TaxID=2024848 RepID=UPI00329A389D